MSSADATDPLETALQRFAQRPDMDAIQAAQLRNALSSDDALHAGYQGSHRGACGTQRAPFDVHADRS